MFGGEEKPSGEGHKSAGTHTNDTFVYVGHTNQWVTVKKTEVTPEPRGWHACCSLANGGVALFGGLSNANERLADFYLFV